MQFLKIYLTKQIVGITAAKAIKPLTTKSQKEQQEIMKRKYKANMPAISEECDSQENEVQLVQ